MIDITVSTDEDTAFTERLDQLLDDHASSVGFPFDSRPINLTAEIDGTFAGGMWVDTLYGWCFIKLLAVAPDQRGQGAGLKLLTGLEDRLREMEIVGMWVDSCGCQADGLAPRLGFTGYGRLEGRVHEEDRIHPTKHLSGGDDAPR